MEYILGYEGRYAVRENGEFYSFLNSRGRIMGTPKIIKPRPNKKRWGYLYIALRDGKGGVKNCIAHRIVAITYIPNPNNYSEVNHIDGDKNNIAASNLEWCTSSQNKRHNIDILGYKNNHSKKVIHQFTMDGEYIKTFESTKMAMEELGKTIRKSDRYSSAGFLWSSNINQTFTKISNHRKIFCKNIYTKEKFVCRNKKEATIRTGSLFLAITSVINGKNKHHNGWIFQVQK